MTNDIMHTPGPWSEPGPYALHDLEIQGKDRIVAVVKGNDPRCQRYEPEAFANALLISTAPDMLELLIDCKKYLQKLESHRVAEMVLLVGINKVLERNNMEV